MLEPERRAEPAAGRPAEPAPAEAPEGAFGPECQRQRAEPKVSPCPEPAEPAAAVQPRSGLTTRLWAAARVAGMYFKHPELALAALRTNGAVRVESVDGQAELVVTSRAMIRPDRRQKEEFLGRKNKYYGLYQMLKEQAVQEGRTLTHITERELRSIGVERSPLLQVSRWGDLELKDHHRIWAVTDNPDLELSIVVHHFVGSETLN